MTTFRTTGKKKREEQYLMAFTPDEKEFLIRKSFKHGVKMAQYIRRRTIPYGWRLELNGLREEQTGTSLQEMTPQHGRSGRRNIQSTNLGGPHGSR